MHRWLLILLTLLIVACDGRPRLHGASASASESPGESSSDDDDEGKSGKLIAFDLTRGAPESTAGGGLFAIPVDRTYPGLLRSIEKAAEDEDATGFFVRFGTVGMGWARTEELGRAFAKLREKKRPVVCHGHMFSNSSMWLAARACDRIWVSPAGDVDSVGIAGQSVYLKGALDKLDVRADFIHVGRYKSAAENLTRTGPSEEARDALLHVLGSMRTHWLNGASQARGKPELKKVLEDGPWSAEAAKGHGLIDAVGYESEALDDLRDRAGGKKPRVAFGPGASGSDDFNLADLLRALAGADAATGGRPHVAVLVARGAITMSGGGGLLDEGGISAQSINKTIRKLKKNDAVKAVVLRIDSPGGSALASDLIWHELRQLAEEKPLIVSVGDMAASGGYYMACAGTHILAENTSIVGSIGVVGGKIVLEGALEKYGVNTVTFPASPEPGADKRAAYMSAITPWDDPTRDRIKAQMSAIYELFLKRVATGRKKGVEDIRKIAEGRIWSGSQGLANGLVDEIGGLGRAIELARKKAELDEDAPVRVEAGASNFFEMLMVGEGASTEEIELALKRYEARRSKILDGTGAIRPFLASLEPLARGEKVAAALPYAVTIE